MAPTPAPGGALETTMLVRAGPQPGETVAALAASTGLQWATTCVLPVLALPVIIGGAPVDHRLDVAAYLGAIVFLLLLAIGTAAFSTDAPLTLAGRGVQRLLNATVRRRNPVTDLPQELLADRDSIRTTLGKRWKAALLAAAGSTGFDYFASLAAPAPRGGEPTRDLPGAARVRRRGASGAAPVHTGRDSDSSRRAWSARSPSPGFPRRTPWRRRCCTASSPIGCLSPREPLRTSSSAAGTRRTEVHGHRAGPGTRGRVCLER